MMDKNQIYLTIFFVQSASIFLLVILLLNANNEIKWKDANYKKLLKQNEQTIGSQKEDIKWQKEDIDSLLKEIETYKKLYH